jgi:hypothetical protein
VEDDSHVVFCQKFLGEKGSVRCHDATGSSFVAKVPGEVFTHFHEVAVKCHSRMLL